MNKIITKEFIETYFNDKMVSFMRNQNNVVVYKWNIISGKQFEPQTPNVLSTDIIEFKSKETVVVQSWLGI